jgi:ABC-type lipoprotein release transport system permease subunit
MIPVLAWRNIWRNKRRTLITAASIFVAVFLSLVMRSIQTGTFNNIIHNVVSSYSGYIQVHRKGYWGDKDINNSFCVPDSLVQMLRGTENIGDVLPRLESFALASSGLKTKGVVVVGIDPEAEDKLTGMKGRILAGRYLFRSDPGILVSGRTAEFFGIGPGDTLVLIGQGYHGTSAAGKWPVTGIVHFNSPQLDSRMVILPLPLAQSFYEAGQNVTSLVLRLKDPSKLKKTMKAIGKTGIPEHFEVMSWDEMMPELVQFVQTKTTSSRIMIGILYMIVGFGIFGTLLMMTIERIRETGMMISLGMQKVKIAFMVLLESVFIGLVGMAAGIAASFPIILYFSSHPVRLAGQVAKTYERFGFESMICFEPLSGYVLNNTLVILVLVLVAAIYPLQKISRLDLVFALHYKV